jgi:hypothetical protein
MAGQQSEDIRFRLRAAPSVARTRVERVALSVEASKQDPDFLSMIRRGDAARDACDWKRAEYEYWCALRLYPYHPGYMVQYGHTLKEQGKLQDAEVVYRSARALGSAPDDVDEHIQFVQFALGHYAPLRPVASDSSDCLEWPPTRQDVEILIALFLHRAPNNLDEVLDLLRAAHTCRAVAVALVHCDAFRAANRELLILLAEQT